MDDGDKKDRRLEVEKLGRSEVRRRKSEDRGRKLWDERKMDNGDKKDRR